MFYLGPTITILRERKKKRGKNCFRDKKMLKLRKKCTKTGKIRKPKITTDSMDSIDAYYKRFCDKNIHDPLFDCCCRVIQVNDDDNNEIPIGSNKGARVTHSKNCSSDMMLHDNFSQLSINGSSSSSGVGGCKKQSTIARKKRKKSANHSTIDLNCNKNTRSVSSLAKNSPMTSTSKKYFSTSDLTCASMLATKSGYLMKAAAGGGAGLGAGGTSSTTIGGKRPLIDLHVKDLQLQHQFVNLKSHLAAFSSSIPDLSQKHFEEISDHDKRILSRMAMRRTKEIAALEDAQLARDYWDKEKIARQKYLAEQNESYYKTIKEKREIENQQTKIRVEKLAAEEKAQIERLKQELAEKEAKTESLLRSIELKKEMEIYKKRQREFQKMDLALVNQQEHVMNDEIWRHILIERLQQRINRADNLRQKIMDVQKCRIQADNQLEQTIHQANYDETKKVERIKLEALRERIQQRDDKYKQFIKHRSQVIHESQRKAKISAAMRDIIKRSISPENVTRYGTSNVPTRPISNLSHCDSHIRLG